MVRTKWDQIIDDINKEEEIKEKLPKDIANKMTIEHTFKTFEDKWITMPWLVRFWSDKTSARMWFLAGTLHGMQTLTEAAKKHADEEKKKGVR
jgi:hypothetical protein